MIGWNAPDETFRNCWLRVGDRAGWHARRQLLEPRR